MVISLQSIWMRELFPRILQRLSLLLIHQQRRADIGTLRSHRYHADQDTSKKNSHFKAFRGDRNTDKKLFSNMLHLFIFIRLHPEGILLHDLIELFCCVDVCVVLVLWRGFCVNVIVVVLLSSCC